MFRKSRSFRPVAAPLETRLLLSLATDAMPDAPVSSTDPAEIMTLAEETQDTSYAPEIAQTTIATGTNTPTTPINTVKGRFVAGEDMRAADAPLTVKLGGTGKVTGLGRAKMAGSIQFGGYRMANHPDVLGTVTLTNARGSVTVKLLGHGGYSEIASGQFVTTATVSKGTKAFRSYQRVGTATVEFGPNTNPSSTATGGKMTLTLNVTRPLK